MNNLRYRTLYRTGDIVEFTGLGVPDGVSVVHKVSKIGIHSVYAFNNLNSEESFTENALALISRKCWK